MNAPAAAPDEGPDTPSPWFEVFGDYGPVEGRHFRDGERLWTVIAITPDYLEKLGLREHALLPGLAGGWLSFECGNERRRLVPIPKNWETMPPEELSMLCQRATPARRPHGR